MEAGLRPLRAACEFLSLSRDEHCPHPHPPEPAEDAMEAGDMGGTSRVQFGSGRKINGRQKSSAFRLIDLVAGGAVNSQ